MHGDDGVSRTYVDQGAQKVPHLKCVTVMEALLENIARSYSVQCALYSIVSYCILYVYIYSVPALPGAHIDRIILTVPQFNDDICSKNSVAQLLGVYADGGRRQDINVDLVHVHCAQH